MAVTGGGGRGTTVTLDPLFSGTELAPRLFSPRPRVGKNAGAELLAVAGLVEAPAVGVLGWTGSSPWRRRVPGADGCEREVGGSWGGIRERGEEGWAEAEKVEEGDGEEGERLWLWLWLLVQLS